MPTYEYKCPKCGTEFETFRKITARSGAKCPKCGAKAESQLSGGAGLVFKGSGFYLTDYGRAGQKAKQSESEKASGESSSGDKKPSTEKPGAEKSRGGTPPAPKFKPLKKDD